MSPIIRLVSGLILIAAAISGCGGEEQASQGDGWRILKSEVPEDPLPITGGNLLVAMDRQAYEGLWVEGQMVGRLPEVDFSSEIVVRADRFSNDDCDEVIFESLDKVPGENAVELTFKPPSGSACRSFGVSHVVFIAVEKESLPKAPLEFRLGEGHGALAAEVASL